MTLTYLELTRSFIPGINKLRTGGVSIDAVMKVLAIQEEAESKLKDYQKSFEQIMQDNGVPVTDNVYDWTEHEKASEITTQLNELLNTPVELKDTNVLEVAEVISLTGGMQLSEVAAFKKALSK